MISFATLRGLTNKQTLKHNHEIRLAKLPICVVMGLTHGVHTVKHPISGQIGSGRGMPSSYGPDSFMGNGVRKEMRTTA